MRLQPQRRMFRGAPSRGPAGSAGESCDFGRRGHEAKTKNLAGGSRVGGGCGGRRVLSDPTAEFCLPGDRLRASALGPVLADSHLVVSYMGYVEAVCADDFIQSKHFRAAVAHGKIFADVHACQGRLHDWGSS